MLAYILALAVGLGSLAIFSIAFFFPEIHRKNDFIWSGLGLFYALVLWVCAGRINGGLLLGQIAGVALLGWSVPQIFLLRRELTPRQQQTPLPSAAEIKSTVQQKVSNLSIPQRLTQLGDRLSRTKDKAQPAKSGTQSKVTAPTPTAQPVVEVIDHTSTPFSARGSANDSTSLREAPPTTPLTSTSLSTSSDRAQDKSLSENRTPISEPPALTEEEAIAQAVEATQSKPEVVTTELVRPNPPTPELVEAAILDAEAKSEEASPPEIVEEVGET